MAVVDLKSILTTIYSDNVVITPGQSIITTILDSRDYQAGVLFGIIPIATSDVDNEISLVNIQNSIDNITWENVDTLQYIGDNNLQNLKLFTPPLVVPTLGVFGTRRYLRLVLSTPATNNSTLTVQIVWILGPTLRPDNENGTFPGSLHPLYSNNNNQILANNGQPIYVGA